jgi:hypothetical protein
VNLGENAHAENNRGALNAPLLRLRPPCCAVMATFDLQPLVGPACKTILGSLLLLRKYRYGVAV